MTCHQGRRAAPLAAALIALAMPATAAPLLDGATGLLVDPPPPYEATAMPAAPPQAARIALRRADAPSSGCQVAFVPAPQNDRSSDQARLNILVRSAEWQKLERLRLSQAYEVQEEAPVEIGDLTALRVLGRLKPRDGVAGGSQALFTILETPPGRTTLVCAAPEADFAARRPEFEALAKGVHPPR